MSQSAQSIISALKGRGAIGSVAHRFEAVEREVWDDGWGGLEALADVAAQPVHTHVRMELCKSAISKNDSPDIFFEQAVNPYRGCEHGCVYCYARPMHSYLGLSPGLDFETKLTAKTNVVQVLEKQISAPGYVPKVINIGSATDCYQPIEREHLLTRQLLKMLLAHKHPISLITKASLVERDIDILQDMAAQGLAAVYVTVTTLDGKLAQIMEPRAAAPYRRLKTIEALANAKIPVGVSVAPHIPFINEDMEHVLKAAAAVGADSAFYTVIRLPLELNEVFQTWLNTHFPDRAERVLNRIRDMRDGKEYVSSFSNRMKGKGWWSDMIRQRFEKTCVKLGLNRERHELRTDLFGVAPQQGTLF
jgi:DNA repair photolyase